MIRPEIVILNGIDADLWALSGYGGPLKKISSRSPTRVGSHLAAIANLNTPYLVMEQGHDLVEDWETTLGAINGVVGAVSPKPGILLTNGANVRLRQTTTLRDGRSTWREVTPADYPEYWEACTAYCVLDAEADRSLRKSLTKNSSLSAAMAAAIKDVTTYGAVTPLFERTVK